MIEKVEITNRICSRRLGEGGGLGNNYVKTKTVLICRLGVSQRALSMGTWVKLNVNEIGLWSCLALG